MLFMSNPLQEVAKRVSPARTASGPGPRGRLDAERLGKFKRGREGRNEVLRRPSRFDGTRCTQDERQRSSVAADLLVAAFLKARPPSPLPGQLWFAFG
jgi:hypothetical protein